MSTLSLSGQVALVTGAGHGIAAPVPKAPPAALRRGESVRTVTSPVSYTPKAPTTGTDDYHCFVLDPGLSRNAFVTGFDIAPGQPGEVHVGAEPTTEEVVVEVVAEVGEPAHPGLDEHEAQRGEAFEHTAVHQVGEGSVHADAHVDERC